MLANLQLGCAADIEDEPEQLQYESDDLQYEAQQEQVGALRILAALQMPGMCDDLGLATPPTACHPLTRAAYGAAFRPW